MKIENKIVGNTLFRHNRNESSFYEVKSSGGVIPNYYLLIQDKWAKKMSAATSRLSKRMLVYLLALFVIFATGFCINLISESLSNTAFKTIKIIPSALPIDVASKSTVINSELMPINKNEFRRITNFRIYLDSLARSPTTKETYDSICRSRPGLLDSLVFIENYYKSNLKK